MPVTRADEPALTQPFPGVQSRALVRPEHDAVSLTVNELTIAVGAQVPLHVHPSHEEGIVILEGQLEATIGSDRQSVGPGFAVLVPKEAAHLLVNKGQTPAKILAIFPTTTPQRRFL